MRTFLIKQTHFQQLFDNKEVAWMGQNTNHLETPAAVKEAMIECIRTEEYHKYAPPLGLEELRERVLQALRLKDSTVWVTHGAVEGIHEIVRVFLRSGDEFVTTDPGWFVCNKFAVYGGAKVIEIPIYNSELDYKLTPELLNEHLTSKTRMIYVVDPNNPLGSAYTREEIRAFCELAEDHKAILLHDCTYRDFADAHYPAQMFNVENTIVDWSFSKWCGFAGLRLGAIISSEENIHKLTEAQVNNFGCNIVVQRGAIAALKSKAEWFPQIFSAVRLHQKMVKDAVDETAGKAYITVYPSQGNFLAIDIKGLNLTPEQICVKLMEKNVFIRHGGYQSRKFADRFVKVSVTVQKSDVEKFCHLFPKVEESIRKEGVEVKPLF